MSNTAISLEHDITQSVTSALAEDIGQGDITALLIDSTQHSSGTVITREKGIACGRLWVEEVFRQIDPSVKIDWQVQDGESIQANSALFHLQGPTRSLLTGERTALNFFQLLSGTATRCRYYADMVADTNVKLLDTRKTIPGLRRAQKYAVTCGGCFNHRMGLFDAFLIKENHIAACGGIATAIESAKRQTPDKTIEVEIENLSELQEALVAGADIIMLDNFTINDIYQAVKINAGQAKLEASGGVTVETLSDIAKTGVDYISIGALTKV